MGFAEEMIQAVWEKARGTSERDPTEWRKDQCGAWLRREQYNHPDAEFGWKVLNVVPGGGDKIEDLQPFHWRNSYDIANGQAHCQAIADRSGVAAGQSVGEPHNTIE
jgi:hypothetical protein